VAFVPVDQSAHAFVVGGLAEPGLGEQALHIGPRRLVDEQIVALDDHEPRVGQHGDLARDGLLDRAVEAGRIDGVGCLGVQSPKQGDETPAVEGVDGTLAVAAAETVERRIGEVIAIHGQVCGEVWRRRW
jgi:hypothetical protein